MTEIARWWLCVGVLVYASGCYDFGSDLTACRNGGRCASTVGAPEVQSPPMITGDAVVGGTLTVSPGSWSNDPTSQEYQWSRCPVLVDAGCVAHSGGTEASIRIAPEDLDNVLEVEVRARNEAGVGTATASSSAIRRAGPAELSAFTGFEAGDLLRPEIGASLTAVDGSVARSGAFAARIDKDGFLGMNRPAPLVLRAAIWLEGLPSSGSVQLARVQTMSGGPVLEWLVSSDGTVRARFESDGPGVASHPLQLFQWHLFEFLIDDPQGFTRLDWRLDGVPQAPAQSGAPLAADLAFVFKASAGVVRIDDLAVSNSVQAWPIGDGSVRALVPIADGAHASAGFFSRHPSGAAFFSAVDRVDLDGGLDYVRQETPSEDAYLEWELAPREPLVGNPQALRVLTVSSADAASSSRADLLLGGASIASGSLQESSSVALGAGPLAQPTSGLTSQDVSQNLRARWGFQASGAPPANLYQLTVEVDSAR